MGTKIEETTPPVGNEAPEPKRTFKVVDATKPWLRQFFECKDIRKEPPINAEGFWKKPKHGFKIEKEGK